MKTYILDGYQFKTRNDSFEYLNSVFQFPDYFGKNLDSLWDVLSDLEDVRIEIIDARQIPKYLQGYGLKILDIFGDINGYRGIEVEMFW
ncbi:MAG: barstar family protein [Tissierellia bacterium]|nr:barstar family protein [Tissierellia bacterium]